MGKKRTKDAFEEALKRLEKIVEKLESGGASLDESLKLYQEGKKLSEFCLKKLTEVEKKIEVLIENESGGQTRLEPLSPADEDLPEDDDDEP